MDLILENIRCFSHLHRVPIRPVTLVTGENSSGKSTLLAALAAATKAYKFPLSPAFNEAPFHLGNYENIATYKGGKYGRADSFKLGYKATHRRGGEIEVIATYANDRGSPTLSRLFVKDAHSQLELESKSDVIVVTAETAPPSGSEKNSTQFQVKKAEAPERSPSAWLSLVFRAFFEPSTAEGRSNRPQNDQLYELLDRAISGGGYTAQAIAPLRTKPLRTYDQLKDDFSPDGDHIPYTLAKLFDEARTDKTAAENVQAMVNFGHNAGLFKNLSVKFLGKNVSDPFQIMVTVSGRPANLVDVGYGVSQSLPIIVSSILASPRVFNLVQQPEVHLHPKAQAAIGTFFCELAAKQKRHFVVETHSDYIVDRVRAAIAERVLKPEDVVLLYLERDQHSSVIHQIYFDSNGNLLAPPLGYREFFMREELKMLQLVSESGAAS